ncbi:MAG TPA: dihydropteroate synthase, partial [Solirubrobacteraceae bacterium]|nr:dihydropteroate synthase [Solirubrobacteraceae bacterium]
MRQAPPYRLHARGRVLELGARPWLMGIVNASPDSFSDGGRYRTLDQRVSLAAGLLSAGADILDVGGESASTNRPPVEVVQEIDRVAPL